jgi:hypothetical protein
VAVKVHGCYIVVIGGKQQQSVSLEIIVVVVAAVCATVAVACGLGRFWANQAGFAGSENGEVTFETWGVC